MSRALAGQQTPGQIQFSYPNTVKPKQVSRTVSISNIQQAARVILWLIPFSSQRSKSRYSLPIQYMRHKQLEVVVDGQGPG